MDRSGFEVITGGQQFHASKAGWMIISKRDSGVHRLQVKRNDSSMAEQVFLLSNLESNRVLLLKQQSSKSWVLADLRDSGVVYASEAGKSLQQQQVKQLQLSGDSFGDLLARVTNDSTVLNVGISTKEDRKKKKKQQQEKGGAIRLKDKQIRAEAYEYLFEIETDNGADTIQVIIERRD